MGRPPRELARQLKHVDAMFILERTFPKLVLLPVMEQAQTEHPSIGRLQAQTPVGPSPAVQSNSLFMRSRESGQESGENCEFQQEGSWPICRYFSRLPCYSLHFREFGRLAQARTRNHICGHDYA